MPSTALAATFAAVSLAVVADEEDDDLAAFVVLIRESSFRNESLADILALEHVSIIFRHYNNPALPF